MDFSANGRYLIASCEFSGDMLRVDVASHTFIGTLRIKKGGMPQDVKTSPDGKVFYVADMMSDGVWMIDGDRFEKIGLSRPAAARIPSMRAGTRRRCTYPIAAKAAFRSSILLPGR